MSSFDEIKSKNPDQLPLFVFFSYKSSSRDFTTFVDVEGGAQAAADFSNLALAAPYGNNSGGANKKFSNFCSKMATRFERDAKIRSVS